MATRKPPKKPFLKLELDFVKKTPIRKLVEEYGQDKFFVLISFLLSAFDAKLLEFRSLEKDEAESPEIQEQFGLIEIDSEIFQEVLYNMHFETKGFEVTELLENLVKCGFVEQKEVGVYTIPYLTTSFADYLSIVITNREKARKKHNQMKESDSDSHHDETYKDHPTEEEVYRYGRSHYLKEETISNFVRHGLHEYEGWEKALLDSEKTKH